MMKIRIGVWYCVAMAMIVVGLFIHKPLTAVAADGPGVTNISLAVGMGTEPSDLSGIGSGFGLGLGAGFYHVGDIEVRGDLNYMNWSKGDVKLTRIPIIFSGRMYFPSAENVKFYAQAGAGMSLDKADISSECIDFDPDTFECISGSSSSSETNFDLVPAGGVEYQVSPVLSVGAEAAYHIVDSSYFTLMGKLSYAIGK